MNEKILNLLNGRESYYPMALESRFPRVLEKMFQLWETPDIDAYFHELMMDTRDGHRQGFPPDVASEILRLSLIHAKQRNDEGKDVWGSISEKNRQGVEQLGFKYSPQGFMQASEAGNTRAIQIFLSSGVSIDTRDERNWEIAHRRSRRVALSGRHSNDDAFHARRVQRLDRPAQNGFSGQQPELLRHAATGALTDASRHNQRACRHGRKTGVSCCIAA